MEEWSKNQQKNNCSLLEIHHMRWQLSTQHGCFNAVYFRNAGLQDNHTLKNLLVPWGLVYTPGLPSCSLLSGNMLRTSEMYPPTVYRAHFSSQCVYFFYIALHNKWNLIYVSTWDVSCNFLWLFVTLLLFCLKSITALSWFQSLWRMSWRPYFPPPPSSSSSFLRWQNVSPNGSLGHCLPERLPFTIVCFPLIFSWQFNICPQQLLPSPAMPDLQHTPLCCSILKFSSKHS